VFREVEEVTAGRTASPHPAARVTHLTISRSPRSANATWDGAIPDRRITIVLAATTANLFELSCDGT
jgi:hypothetical protein